MKTITKDGAKLELRLANVNAMPHVQDGGYVYDDAMPRDHQVRSWLDLDNGTLRHEQHTSCGYRQYIDFKGGHQHMVDDYMVARFDHSSLTTKGVPRRRLAKSISECFAQWTRGMLGSLPNFGNSDWGTRERGDPKQSVEENDKLVRYNKGNHLADQLGINPYNVRMGEDYYWSNNGVRDDRYATNYDTTSTDSYDALGIATAVTYAVRSDELTKELCGYMTTKSMTPATIHQAHPEYKIKHTRMHRLGQQPGEGYGDLSVERRWTETQEESSFTSPFQCDDLVRHLAEKMLIPMNNQRRTENIRGGSSDMVGILQFTNHTIPRYHKRSYNRVPIIQISKENVDHDIPHNTFFILYRRIAPLGLARRVSPRRYRLCGREYLISNCSYTDWDENDGKMRHSFGQRLLPVTDQEVGVTEFKAMQWVTNRSFAKDFIDASKKDRWRDQYAKLAKRLNSGKRVVMIDHIIGCKTGARATSCQVENRGKYVVPGYRWHGDTLYRKTDMFARLVEHRGKYFCLYNSKLTYAHTQSYGRYSPIVQLENFFDSLKIDGKPVITVPCNAAFLTRATDADWRKHYNRTMDTWINLTEQKFKTHMRARTLSHQHEYHMMATACERLYKLANPALFESRVNALRAKPRIVHLMMKTKALEAVNNMA